MSNELKQRYYITPSSLASYFGCGFNSPEEQFAIDSGQMAADFDDDSKLRMSLGSHLEDAVINYFQDEVFKVPITDRNSELKWGYDNKISYKIDGKLILDEPYIFENKISNSQSYKFTENRGYHIQVQTYMLCEGLKKAILAGLYQGKPVWVKIERDEDLIEDIKRVTDFVYSALNGIVDFYKDFPVDILQKYSNTKLYEPIDSLSERTVEYLHQLAILNSQKSEIEKRIKDLQKQHENDLELTEGVYEDDFVSLRVSNWTQKGGFDLDKFKNDNPVFDLSEYMKPDVIRTRTTLKLK